MDSKFGEVKQCKYCQAEFSRKDFPRTFHRMITCGNINCAEERRIELWQLRYKRWKENKITNVIYD